MNVFYSKHIVNSTYMYMNIYLSTVIGIKFFCDENRILLR